MEKNSKNMTITFDSQESLDEGYTKERFLMIDGIYYLLTKIQDPTKNIYKPKTLFVRGIPPTYNIKMLFNDFSKFGKVDNCVLAYDTQGQLVGYGYIQFDNAISIEVCQTYFDTNHDPKSQISVRKYSGKSEIPKPTTVRITNPFTTGDSHSQHLLDEFKEFLQQFGEINEFILSEAAPYNIYCKYKTEESAKKAVAALEDGYKGHQLEALIQVKSKITKRIPTYINHEANLFVTGLIYFQNLEKHQHPISDEQKEKDEQKNKEELKSKLAEANSYLSLFGTILSSRVAMSAEKTPIGFYISYKETASAEKCRNELNGKITPIEPQSERIVKVFKVTTREERDREKLRQLIRIKKAERENEKSMPSEQDAQSAKEPASPMSGERTGFHLQI
eukprot:GHVN01095750.1.p1 GENE.GHVN01095750.1~~GHVN01095750.1.p1  ORF type:complete len:402 (+),score=36.82 GHVN01095750.1:34-1206(+)